MVTIPLTKHQNGDITSFKDELSKEQIAFLRFCGEVRYGTVEVKIKDGVPVMSRIVEQWHKHD